ncbi:hypothetical protein BDW22DRAFT_1357460 [Trametopsis cervina]|nr:hypothetical protein BDW22DRAFT_1357460 [Trametopsis cervina]
MVAELTALATISAAFHAIHRTIQHPQTDTVFRRSSSIAGDGSSRRSGLVGRASIDKPHRGSFVPQNIARNFNCGPDERSPKVRYVPLPMRSPKNGRGRRSLTQKCGRVLLHQ